MHRIKNELYTNSKHPKTKLQSRQQSIKLISQIWFHQSFHVLHVPPVEKGELLPIFERVMLHRLDTFSVEQKAYYDMTTTRFQHLDDQIEVVQEQLNEFYHHDD